MGLRYDYLPLSTLPRLHDIVWCRLPDQAGAPGAAVLPALVRSTRRDPKTGRGGVEVSYGSARLDSNHRRSVDLIIQNAERLARLDLPMAVRFDLGLANLLPWASEFFYPPEHSYYIVAGRLNSDEVARLRKCLLKRGVILAL